MSFDELFNNYEKINIIYSLSGLKFKVWLASFKICVGFVLCRSKSTLWLVLICPGDYICLKKRFTYQLFKLWHWGWCNKSFENTKRLWCHWGGRFIITYSYRRCWLDFTFNKFIILSFLYFWSTLFVLMACSWRHQISLCESYIAKLSFNLWILYINDGHFQVFFFTYRNNFETPFNFKFICVFS